MQLLPKAQEAGQTIIHALHDVPPFSRLDRKQFEAYLMQAFPEKAFAELNKYLQLPMEQQAVSNITGAHPLAALLIRVIPVLGHLSYSLRQYKMTLTAFAEFLQENAEIRTPTGYAAAFGQFFKENATLFLQKPQYGLFRNCQKRGCVEDNDFSQCNIITVTYQAFVFLRSQCLPESPQWKAPSGCLR
mgnify:CR=1 FL=1